MLEGKDVKVHALPKELLRLWNERVTPIARSSGFSTGLLIVSSAALGGIAVALWNRKTLAAFHEHGEQVSPVPAPPLEDIEDLFGPAPAAAPDPAGAHTKRS